MNPTPTAEERIRSGLRGYAAPTVEAGARYVATGDPAAFDALVFGVIAHHLPRKPAEPLEALPGSTKLVADLGLDSFTMIELVFAFEDLFAVALSQEKLMAVVTIDDLRAFLRENLPAPKGLG